MNFNYRIMRKYYLISYDESPFRIPKISSDKVQSFSEDGRTFVCKLLDINFGLPNAASLLEQEKILVEKLSKMPDHHQPD